MLGGGLPEGPVWPEGGVPLPVVGFAVPADDVLGFSFPLATDVEPPPESGRTDADDFEVLFGLEEPVLFIQSGFTFLASGSSVDPSAALKSELELSLLHPEIKSVIARTKIRPAERDKNTKRTIGIRVIEEIDLLEGRWISRI